MYYLFGLFYPFRWVMTQRETQAVKTRCFNGATKMPKIYKRCFFYYYYYYLFKTNFVICTRLSMFIFALTTTHIKVFCILLRSPVQYAQIKTRFIFIDPQYCLGLPLNLEVNLAKAGLIRTIENEHLTGGKCIDGWKLENFGEVCTCFPNNFLAGPLFFWNNK